MQDIQITIDWIRHGYSCANAYKNTYKYTSLISSLINDPVLTKTGIEQAKKLNEYLSKDTNNFDYDIICCSNLRRAIETAAFAFNKNNKEQKLYILPYISEVKNPGSYLNLDKENFAIDKEESIKYIDLIISKNNLKIKQDYSIYNEFLIKDEQNIIYPNYDKFIKHVLPFIIKKIGYNKKSYKIGIVSHSHFISTIIKDINKSQNMVRVDNTSIWRETLIIKPTINIEFQVKERLNLCDNNVICNQYKGVVEGEQSDNLLRCKRTSRLFGKADNLEGYESGIYGGMCKSKLYGDTYKPIKLYEGMYRPIDI